MNGEELLNLKHDVSRHEDDLDKLQERIESLEADLRFFIQNCPPAVNNIVACSNNLGNLSFNQALAQFAHEFVNKYGLRG